MARTPGHSAIIVLTLALGIGATTTIYGVVHGVLLRPLPFPDQERACLFCFSEKRLLRFAHDDKRVER